MHHPKLPMYWIMVFFVWIKRQVSWNMTQAEKVSYRNTYPVAFNLGSLYTGSTFDHIVCYEFLPKNHMLNISELGPTSGERKSY